jgi:hypothetical protein
VADGDRDTDIEGINISNDQKSRSLNVLQMPNLTLSRCVPGEDTHTITHTQTMFRTTTTVLQWRVQFTIST